MIAKISTHHRSLALLPALLLLLLASAGAVQAAGGTIDSVYKFAWGGNVGWLNFAPTHGGATVYDDHLEGYIWAENIGWIRLGSYEGGGAHTYANTSAANYGVNIDGSGNLSGFAWSSAAGWLNFNPSHSQVTINLTTGDFDGYVWGENIGWIHFQNSSPAYKVKTGVTTTDSYSVYLPIVIKND